MVNYACAFSHSELGKYFEWIIIQFILYIVASLLPFRSHFWIPSLQTLLYTAKCSLLTLYFSIQPLLKQFCQPSFIYSRFITGRKKISEKWIYINLFLANVSDLQKRRSKYEAKMVNATFAYQKAGGVNNKANVTFTIFTYIHQNQLLSFCLPLIRQVSQSCKCFLFYNRRTTLL